MLCQEVLISFIKRDFKVPINSQKKTNKSKIGVQKQGTITYEQKICITDNECWEVKRRGKKDRNKIDRLLNLKQCRDKWALTVKSIGMKL